jgi:hypothetical protein
VVVVVFVVVVVAGAAAVITVHIISLELRFKYVYFCTNEGHEISLHKINVNMLCQAQPIFAMLINGLNIRTERRVGTTVKL